MFFFFGACRQVCKVIDNKLFNPNSMCIDLNESASNSISFSSFNVQIDFLQISIICHFSVRTEKLYAFDCAFS